MIQIAIVDDELLLISLLKEFFEQQTGINCLFTATSGEALLAQLQTAKQQPDIILLDLKMQGMNGDEVAVILKKDYPQINVLIMSTYYQETFMSYMLRAGASAFLPKDIPPDQLVKAIQEIYTNGVYFTAKQLTFMQHRVKKNDIKPKLFVQDELTNREKEVLTLICQQRTTKEIAEMLFISTRTVETHRNNLLMKTNAKNGIGLAIYAIQHRLINDAAILSFP